MEEETLSALETLALESIREGERLDRQGQPHRAEQQYLTALRTCETLYRRTGDRRFASAARDCCLSLADLNMQQGNMHGADAYYVRAMDDTLI